MSEDADARDAEIMRRKTWWILVLAVALALAAVIGFGGGALWRWLVTMHHPPGR